MSENKEHDAGRDKTYRFTIDGQHYTVDDKHQDASALLLLAGLDPTMFDLAEIKNKGEIKTFKDDQQVVIKNGEEFVTVRQSAPVG